MRESLDTTIFGSGNPPLNTYVPLFCDPNAETGFLSLVSQGPLKGPKNIGDCMRSHDGSIGTTVALQYL